MSRLLTTMIAISFVMSLPATAAAEPSRVTKTAVEIEVLSERSSRMTVSLSLALYPSSPLEIRVPRPQDGDFLEIADVYLDSLSVGSKRIRVDSSEELAPDGAKSGFLRLVVPASDVAQQALLKYHTTRTLKENSRERFVYQKYFPRGDETGEFSLSVTTPKHLQLHGASSGVQIKSTRTSATVVYSANYPGHAAQKYDPREPSVAMAGPYILFSAYGSYDDLAHYYDQTLDSEKPSGEASLAWLAELVRTSETLEVREKILAISEGIKRRVSFQVSDFGQFLPRPADDIISSGKGDCKELVSLLRLALTSAGIEARRAVVSTDLNYATSAIPFPQYNHVIVYLPELRAFLDPSTPSGIGFILPPELYGKTAFIVDDRKHLRIPAANPTEHSVRYVADVRLAADGQIAISSVVTVSGFPTIAARVSALRARSMSRTDLAAVVARNTGLSNFVSGEAEVFAGDSIDASVAVKSTIKLRADWIGTAEKVPAGLSLVRDGWRLALGTVTDRQGVGRFVCFPLTVVVSAVSDGSVRFHSSQALSGSTGVVQVIRRGRENSIEVFATFATDGPLCETPSQHETMEIRAIEMLKLMKAEQ